MVVWIEIFLYVHQHKITIVTTCVVVWIEIPKIVFLTFGSQSPPAWWCGLKFRGILFRLCPGLVTTCVVVWIEISSEISQIVVDRVTTCVVVWIEIGKITSTTFSKGVTTCVVVWIEIL